MYTLFGSFGTHAVKVIASLNMVVLASLAGEAASGYLGNAMTPNYHAARIRLQLARVVLWVATVIAALKITLPAALADGLISAWFVGQGFALQGVSKSILAGIVARYDENLHRHIMKGEGTVTYKEYKDATVISRNLTTFTLKKDTQLLVLPWTAVYDLVLRTQ